MSSGDGANKMSLSLVAAQSRLEHQGAVNFIKW